MKPNYAFDGAISREALENHLARANTFAEWLSGIGSPEDNLRLLAQGGVKFAGRSIYRWGHESVLDAVLATARPLAEEAHRRDPDLILQAAIFEAVTPDIEKVPVPEWLFAEFGLPAETRNFRYAEMLYPAGSWETDHWGPGSSVPDMSRLETRMWFVYAAVRYFEIGVEAIHFGQVELMDHRDPDHRHWADMLARVRRRAAKGARRHFVLCDAHVPSGGLFYDGRLLFDFHSFPLRLEEVPDKPEEAVFLMGHLDSIYGRSRGGLTPSGWRCEHLPYLVEFDNFELSGHPGENTGRHWIWGYDEISWFAHQPADYRRRWLRYAWDWVRSHDPNGYLQMPGSRMIGPPARGLNWYWANHPSPAVPGGFGDEDAIREIWASQPRPAGRPGSHRPA